MMLAYRKNLLAVFFLCSYLYAPIANAAEGGMANAKTLIIKSSEDYANTPWAKLRIPAGTKLITYQSKSGKELHNLEFVGGVSISELENGDILSVDNNGGGVMCAWEISADIRTTLEKCYPKEKELKQNFDLVIEKLKNFIVANNLTPITKEELENDLQKKRKDFPDRCTANVRGMAEKLVLHKYEFIKEFQKSTDAFLATPRPPVFNPCL
jgi:hypothetical protein